jgi:hypothetical protein
MDRRLAIIWALGFLALTSAPGLAQGRGHGRGREHAPGQLKKQDEDRDRDHGQGKGEDRGDEGRDRGRFNDNDRALAHNWYFHNRAALPPGLRDRDRLPPGIEARFRPGWVIEPELRPVIYAAPVILVRRFAPAPPGCRYVLIGGHVVLVDAGFRVLDFFRLRLDIGG